MRGLAIYAHLGKDWWWLEEEVGGGGERLTSLGGPAGELGDFVEAGGAAGFDLGFATFAAEAGLVRGGG